MRKQFQSCLFLMQEICPLCCEYGAIEKHWKLFFFLYALRQFWGFEYIWRKKESQANFTHYEGAKEPSFLQI